MVGHAANGFTQMVPNPTHDQRLGGVVRAGFDQFGRNERPAQSPQHLPNGDLVGARRERVAATGPTRRTNDLGAAQGGQQLLQKLFGNALASGNVTCLDRTAARTALRGQIQHGAQAVIFLGGKVHCCG